MILEEASFAPFRKAEDEDCTLMETAHFAEQVSYLSS